MLTSPRYGIGHFYETRHFYQYPQRLHVFCPTRHFHCVLHYCTGSRIMTFHFYVVSETVKHLYLGMNDENSCTETSPLTSTPAVTIPPNHTFCSKEYETCIFPPLHIALSSVRFATVNSYSHVDSNITTSTGSKVLLPLPSTRERIAYDCPLPFSLPT